MNYELKINTNVTCRTCLSQEKKLENIFCKEIVDSTVYSFSKIVHQICGIRVSQTDRLPTKICLSCKDQIKLFYSFRQMCDRSQELLNNIYYEQNSLKENGISVVISDKQSDNCNNEEQEIVVNIDSEDSNENENSTLNDNFMSYEILESVDIIPSNSELIDDDIDVSSITYDDQDNDDDDDNDNESDENDNNNTTLIKNKKICQYCTRVFSKSTDLKRHIDTHFHVRYKCRICSKTYTQLAPRNRHMKYFHPDEMADLIQMNEIPFSANDPYNLPIKGNVIMIKEKSPKFSERKLRKINQEKKTNFS